ncbi:zinc finger protein 384 isoform X3 [Alligator mississippiensis]|nr:zinc finger protein 384 isoform X3 [Alligator mississippiensis]XP_019331697.1 zinc finger protein 384 isoform X3 [Alligator mississippiensis]XP_059576403.1 zinc finger protein 384 isoform X3 [Alligator mississippiensis]XP_059576404.1 zinc finger protein 384 isoform X3 [Alligator mississippiensis]XP_059576405.1 zinc finger protein 384 isoform X3 [Alligator mississippiensis]XP_059576406.1 zinc finger protein 384 isoform X3 [Alligator mississippiensis]XP_059576407.1 zinc finger protein 384 is
MEESHFNSSPYFWPTVPTVSGQIENTMFINKMKEQLLPTEKGCSLAPPHYPTLLTVPTSVALSTGISMDSDTKPEQLTPHSQAPVTQNITVVPVQSAGLMTAGPGLVITSPSGSLVTTAASAQTFPISAPMIVSALPHGSQAALQVVPDLSKKGTAALSEGSGGGGGGGVAPKPPRGRKKKRLQESGLPEMSDPFVLSNEDDEDQHKDGKTYRCRMCSLTFYSKSEMQIHSKSHTETKPHKCPHCSKSFANSSYLAQHIRIHSGAKPYTCSYCQKAFRQLSHLQQHTRIHSKLHTAIVKPHKCPHCSKSFANTSYLAQHLRIHSGAKPYSCRYCQKAFRQLSHLQQHTRIHTGDRPYKCAHPGCEKAFTQLSNLQSHRRQHNKDKPFKCHNCHRAYTDAASLEVHLATHTVKHAKVYTCSICSRAYTSETYLMKHMRKHNIPDPQQQVAQAQAQASQQQQQHFQPQGGGAAGGPSGDTNPPNPPPQCSFDLTPYKTSEHHKDICLTVSTSTIQVEHLSSS